MPKKKVEIEEKEVVKKVTKKPAKSSASTKKTSTTKATTKKDSATKKVVKEKAPAKKTTTAKKTSTTKKETTKTTSTTAKKKTVAKKEVIKEPVKKTPTKKTTSTKTVAKSVAKKKEPTKKSTTKKTETPTQKKVTKKSTTTAKKTTVTKEKPVKKTVTIKKAPAKKTTTAKAKTTKKAVAKKEPVKKKTTTKKTSVKKEIKPELKIETMEFYDLPYRYGHTVVQALYQSPNVLFVYWDISDHDRDMYKLNYGENFFETTKPVLIVHNRTMGYYFEIDIDDFASNWYIRINDVKCDYQVELGRRFRDNLQEYVHVTHSNPIETPNDRILFETLLGDINFKNVKTGEETSKNFNEVLYNNSLKKIKDLYKNIYQLDDIDELRRYANPSSNFSS